ncbi:MAG: respiratory nitrate reductase subunit gamma [Planctomycetota bacterium]
MDGLRWIVGAVLPYVAGGVFLVGMIWRIRSWKKLPSPPMTLFPAPPTERANLRNTIQEALLFRSLFKGDRWLWVFAWGFHAVLALIFLGHLRVFTNVDRLLIALGMSAGSIRAMSAGAGGAAGVLILLATILLLVRRVALPRVREITGAADYLALLLVGAIIMTGNLMRFGTEHFDLTLTQQYFTDVATLGDASGAAALRNNVFIVHMGLAFLLVVCLPFSKLLHFGGIFFTHQLLRKQ